jgi:broad specificity phosphatase PhoE
LTKLIELRRHTANDGDVLTLEGVEAALDIGRALGPFDLVVSTGAQRATQTAACFLAVNRHPVRGGVIVDEGFRSLNEDRWRQIYQSTKVGDLAGFLAADREFVEEEAMRFTEALHRVCRHLPEEGTSLVVGHSPMLEAAVWGATGRTISALGKGSGVVLVYDDGGFRLRE